MPNAAEKSYEVGHGKPPKHTQFPKGRSGNPTGRPRKTSHVAAELNAEFDILVMLNADGRKTAITKREAALRQTVAKALKGNIRALKFVMKLLRKVEPRKKEPTWDIRYYKPPNQS